MPINELYKLDDWLKKVSDDMGRANSPAHLRIVGEAIIEDIRIGGGIRVRTRLGYGVDVGGGQKTKLKALSTRYIEYRRTFKGLSKYAKVKFSNLTLTGSMLDSLQVTSAAQNTITIEPTGTDKKGVSNKNKAAWQQRDHGRNFLTLSKQEVKKAREVWVTTLSGLLNQNK